MLKIFSFLKKSNTEQSEEKQNDKPQLIEQVSNFIFAKIKEAQNEFYSIREKTKDLSTTNYELALRHLDKGNISEATFRLKIVHKFWPERHEALYALAYCLILQEKFEQAEKIINELLSANPEYQDKADELLESIKKQAKISAEG